MISDGTIRVINSFRKTYHNRLYDIEYLENRLKNLFPEEFDDVILTGALSNRIAIFSLIEKKNTWLLIYLVDDISVYKNYDFLTKTIIKSYNEYVHLTNIPKTLVNRFKRPKTLLISLCHNEIFPFPRFPLGISEIAEAVRSNFLGKVSLLDMQLGEDLKSIVEYIFSNKPEIVGISLTFGQHDILERLLSELFDKCGSHLPVLVAGGSLAALNHRQLLNQFPDLIVCLGTGGLTMCDIITYWNKKTSLCNINYIAYSFNRKIKYSTKKNIDEEPFPKPELDLLGKTLKQNGVIQLESSKGCPNKCSFCPRHHKGKWMGCNPKSFQSILPYISKIFDQYNHHNRKIFLVDEECIGGTGDEHISRMKNIATDLFQNNFNFEISSRIDQVYNEKKDFAWHIKRIEFWKYLLLNGLEKVLFGIESGVDSILERFNKNLTKIDIIKAVRLLSILNIPVRYTYITFDPLMSLHELKESFYFIGRKDLILNPIKKLSNHDALLHINDNSYTSKNSSNLPLYRRITYMLVSLVCLNNSKYLKIAKDKQLVNGASSSIGKMNVSYIDHNIGLISHASQLWIDRNFTFDYTLKSIIKISKASERQIIYDLRGILKDHCYFLLAKLLFLLTKDLNLLISISSAESEISHLQKHYVSFHKYSTNDLEKTHEIFNLLLEHQFNELINEIYSAFNSLRNDFNPKQLRAVNNAIEIWVSQKKWELINT